MNPSTRWGLLGLASLLLHPARGDDWPRWMGPTGDGVYYEDGIVDAIPADGLKIQWRVPVAGGYAGPAVVGERVYLFDFVKSSGEAFNDPGKRATLQGIERVLCLDAKTGKTNWTYQYDCTYSISYPAGPRCTPTVDVVGPDDPGRVYVLGCEGDFACLDAMTGEVIWKRSLKVDFGAAVPLWGFSSHPLVDGDLVYCMVGGTGQTVVAFDKMTGEIKWKSLSASAVGYCPPSIITAGGVRQLVVWHADAIVSLDPSSGNQFWEIPLRPDYEMAIARPQLSGNQVYASGIRTESVLFELATDRPTATEIWRGENKKSVFSAISTPIFHDGMIYGTDCNEGFLVAVDATSGERLWTTFAATQPKEKRRLSHGNAFLTRLDGSNRYLLMSEIGDLVMANLTKKGYEELGRFHVLEPTGEAFGRPVVWSHPAYAHQTAYVRNDKEIVAVSFAK